MILFILFLINFALTVALYPLAGYVCNYVWEVFIAPSTGGSPGMWVFVGLFLISAFWRRIPKNNPEETGEDVVKDSLRTTFIGYTICGFVSLTTWILSHWI